MKNVPIGLLFVFILSTAISIAIISCEEMVEPKPKLNPTETISGRMKIEIVEIDSCEYLFGNWQNGKVIEHKGNCKNPTHKNNQ